MGRRGEKPWLQASRPGRRASQQSDRAPVAGRDLAGARVLHLVASALKARARARSFPALPVASAGRLESSKPQQASSRGPLCCVSLLAAAAGCWRRGTDTGTRASRPGARRRGRRARSSCLHGHAWSADVLAACTCTCPPGTGGSVPVHGRLREGRTYTDASCRAPAPAAHLF